MNYITFSFECKNNTNINYIKEILSDFDIIFIVIEESKIKIIFNNLSIDNEKVLMKIIKENF
jgi:hypothetical protein